LQTEHVKYDLNRVENRLTAEKAAMIRRDKITTVQNVQRNN